MLIAIPKETLPGEKRVAATPESVKKLISLGFEISVERGAGAAAGYADVAYTVAGARLTEASEAYGNADVIAKVRPPTLLEAGSMREGALLISLVQPERNPGLLAALEGRKASVLALERIPRITRAQKMDVLSSTALVAGNRAVLEAAQHFQRFFGPQVTAAGTSPPAKVLVIGAGVAGLAAVATARAMGAEVRAFDTRAAAREQVESLGAAFLEVSVKEAGEGVGGYATTMSPEFIAAEMALFRRQAAEVDIVITTALVPGAKAPILLATDIVECFKPGSVIVDMAAEQGGNCELCRPGEVVEHHGVKIVGYTDLASRMASTSSRFFAANVAHLLADMTPGGTFRIDLENDVVRPALILHDGLELPRPVAKPAVVKPRTTLPPPPDVQPKLKDILSPTRTAWGTTLGSMVVLGLLFAAGRFAPADFLQHATVFILACFIGWQVVWAVTPALHTPLMSVTNAISGIIIVGGLLQVGAHLDATSLLGAAAVLFASINIAGGFLVTQRMLKMFQRAGGAR